MWSPLATLALLALSPSQDPYTWDDLSQRASAAIGGRDVGAVSLELAEAEPSDVGAILVAFLVAVRAGHEARCLQYIDRLAEVAPGLSERMCSRLEQVLEQRGESALARRFYERFPQIRPSLVPLFFDEWVRAESVAGVWTWLAERTGPREFEWLARRARFARKHGLLTELLSELRARALDRPDDPETTVAILAVLYGARGSGGLPDVVDLSEWLDFCQPVTAVDACAWGELLRRSHEEAAVAWLERALELPHGIGDRSYSPLRRMSRSFAMSATREETLRERVLVSLEGLYEALDRSRDLARVQEERLALWLPRMTDPLLYTQYAYYAARLEQRLESRTVAEHLDALEGQGSADVGYWYARAGYDHGRSDLPAAEAAYRRADELAGRPEFLAAGGTGPAIARRVHSRTLAFLREARGVAAAESYLNDAWQRVGPEDPRLQVLGDPRATTSGPGLQPGLSDDFIWAALASPYGWSSLHLLTAAIQRTPARERDGFLIRIEPLVVGHEWKWVRLAQELEKAGWTEPALTLWRQLASAAETIYDREQWGAHLCSALLEAGDVSRAEGAAREFVEARSDDEGWVYVLHRLALAAAEVGRTDDALRLWAEVVGLDRLQLTGLTKLRDAGLGPALVEFYEELARKDPESVAPSRALDALR